MSPKNLKIWILFLFPAILCMGCKREDVPSLQTSEASHILIHSLVAGGILVSDGGALITESGICWSTGDQPSISDIVTVNTNGSDTFAIKIPGLEPNSTYYFRTYAKNSAGVGYGNIVSCQTLSETLFDVDNNLYKVIQIGDQVWMAENFRTTHLNEDTPIPQLKTSWGSVSSPAYCWHSNNEADYKYPYGALYNWYAVAHEKFCPDGWRVPNHEDWTNLVDYLGGFSVAADKLKETGTVYWFLGNSGATNESGFTGRPGGMRLQDGTFYPVWTDAYWWSASESGSMNAENWQIFVNSPYCVTNSFDKSFGLSVRLMRD